MTAAMRSYPSRGSVALPSLALCHCRLCESSTASGPVDALGTSPSSMGSSSSSTNSAHRAIAWAQIEDASACGAMLA